MKSRDIGLLLVVVALVMAFSTTAGAASFPTKTITITMPAAPGGSTDMTGRMLAKRMTEILGQPVVVENKSGAGGFLVGNAIAAAKPDGYYIAIEPSSAFNMAHFLRNPPFDIHKFTPIMSYGIYPFTLAVKTDAPWKTFKEFIEYAKAHPNEVTLATSNPDSMENLPIWMLEGLLGLKMKLVSYEGGAPACAAVLGGHATAFTGVGEAIPFIRDGSMRGLATYLGERMSSLPDIPTLKELGYDVVVESRLTVYGPPGVPKDVVKILQDSFHKAMDNEDFKKICTSFEVTPSYLDAVQLEKYHTDLAAKTKPILIKLGKIKN
jgi:tripartite-type tricarboxylate transporter receptor subunit TctC